MNNSIMADELDEFWLRKTQKSPENGEAWMLTFADLLSLILTFFIMMYSMSQLHKTEWHRVVRSFQGQFKMHNKSAGNDVTSDMGINRIDVPEALNLDYLYAVLQQKLAQSAFAEGIHLSQLDDRILLSISSDMLFTKDGASVNAEGKALITSLGEAMQQFGNRVDVIAHTDPTRVSGEAFPSAWELTLARAIVIAETLHSTGNGLVVNAFGNADAQFSYLPHSATDEEKYRLARRVDIVIRSSQRDYLPEAMFATPETEGVSTPK
jgi:chemotaxis protein MotB